tara:strand:+ start:2407 stop:3036 length:630 start_codon:yes stop_codon:yes gene_type:complete
MGMWDWMQGKEGWIPDVGGQSTTDSIKSFTGAGPNEGWLPDNQGYIPDNFTGGTPTKQAIVDNTVGQNYMDGNEGYIPDALPVIGTKEKAGDAYNKVTGMFSSGSIRDFDMNDPESVKALQTKLGVKADGMFGPKTEAAYRQAVDGERQAAGQESLRYDYNEGGKAPRTKLGGWLKNAYSNLDKGVGGILPGGYKKNISDMTAEEYANR